MTKNQMDKIRAAVCKNRGGFGAASDEEIMSIWRHLNPDTQKQYLESIKERKDENAVSDKTGRDL